MLALRDLSDQPFGGNGKVRAPLLEIAQVSLQLQIIAEHTLWGTLSCGDVGARSVFSQLPALLRGKGGVRGEGAAAPDGQPLWLDLLLSLRKAGHGWQWSPIRVTASLCGRVRV